MYIVLLNLAHKLKCETNLTLTHVVSHLPFAMAMFRRQTLSEFLLGLPDVFCKNTGFFVNSDKNLMIQKNNKNKA